MDNNIGVNLRMEILKQNIVALIGESQIPVGATYYILKDLFNDITNAYQKSIELEQKSLENDSNEDKKKNNKSEIVDKSSNKN